MVSMGLAPRSVNMARCASSPTTRRRRRSVASTRSSAARTPASRRDSSKSCAATSLAARPEKRDVVSGQRQGDGHVRGAPASTESHARRRITGRRHLRHWLDDDVEHHVADDEDASRRHVRFLAIAAAIRPASRSVRDDEVTIDRRRSRLRCSERIRPEGPASPLCRSRRATWPARAHSTSAPSCISRGEFTLSVDGIGDEEAGGREFTVDRGTPRPPQLRLRATNQRRNHYRGDRNRGTVSLVTGDRHTQAYRVAPTSPRCRGST